MTELRVMVGIPGSGKSSLAEYWLAIREVDVIISSDAIRKEITGDASDVSQDGKIWPVFYGRLSVALRDGKRIVADATHLTSRSRNLIVQYAKVNGIVPSAHIIRTPYEVACERNKSRARVVPDFVMERMFRNYQHSCSVQDLEDEGFEVWEYETE